MTYIAKVKKQWRRYLIGGCAFLCLSFFFLVSSETTKQLYVATIKIGVIERVGQTEFAIIDMCRSQRVFPEFLIGNLRNIRYSEYVTAASVAANSATDVVTLSLIHKGLNVAEIEEKIAQAISSGIQQTRAQIDRCVAEHYLATYSYDLDQVISCKLFGTECERFYERISAEHWAKWKVITKRSETAGKFLDQLKSGTTVEAENKTFKGLTLLNLGGILFILCGLIALNIRLIDESQ